MTRDYARTKNNPPNKRGGSSIPGWVWLLTGMVTGAFVTFLFYLSRLDSVPTENTSTNTGSQPTREIKQVLEKPIFEFYDTLMNSEVITSVKENSGDDAVSPSRTYMLQVASFKKLTDADSLKAQLILQGMDTRIAEFNNHGEIYHRVIVGPFTDTAKMATAKKSLAELNLSPIVLQKRITTDAE